MEKRQWIMFILELNVLLISDYNCIVPSTNSSQERIRRVDTNNYWWGQSASSTLTICESINTCSVATLDSASRALIMYSFIYFFLCWHDTFTLIQRSWHRLVCWWRVYWKWDTPSLCSWVLDFCLQAYSAWICSIASLPPPLAGWVLGIIHDEAQ